MPTIQTPVAGTSPNQVDNAAATEGGVIPGAGSTIENIVLEQDKTDGYSNSYALDFVSKIFGNEWKEVVGAYERYWIAYPQKMLNFSSPSFIPGISNVGGTDASAVRRDPAGKLFANPRFIYPLWDDRNIKMSYRTYQEGQYVNVMLNNEAIDKIQASAQVEQDFKYAYANQLLFGSKMMNSDGTADFAYEGLKDLVTNAKGSGSGVSINAVDVLSTTNTNKVITYTPVSSATPNSSMIEALAQLRQSIFALRNLNSYFTYGDANGVRPLNESGQDIARKYVMVGSNQLIESIKGFNYTIFKDLNAYFNVEQIEELPLSIFDVHYDGTASASVVQMAGAIPVASSLGLSASQVLVFDANALVKRKYKITPTSTDFFTTNITSKVQKQEIFWSNYKINAPVMIFDFATALDFMGAMPTTPLYTA